MNKKILMFAVIGLFSMVLITGAVLLYYGQIEQTFNVEQAVTLTGTSCTDNICIETMENVFSPDSIVSKVYTLTNNDPVNSRAITLDNLCTPTSGVCDDVTTRYVEYFDDAGADFSDYGINNGLTCGSTIAASSLNSISGSGIVCVNAGTYTGNVNVPAGVTLVAVNAPNSGTPTIIVGLVDLPSDGASLIGFKVTPGSVPNQEAAITILADNIAVESNFITGMSSTAGGSIKGIYVAGGSAANPVNNVIITNNKIEGITNTAKGTYGMMIQGAVNHVDITYNTVKDLSSGGWHAVGIEVTPTGAHTTIPTDVLIEYNSIVNMGDGSEEGKSITIDWYDGGTTYSADASEVMVNHNNFDETSLDIRSMDISNILDATNNWFGVNGINVQGDINADWMTKTDFTLDTTEVDGFGIVNDFPLSSTPFNSGKITTEVLPA